MTLEFYNKILLHATPEETRKIYNALLPEQHKERAIYKTETFIDLTINRKGIKPSEALKRWHFGHTINNKTNSLNDEWITTNEYGNFQTMNDDEMRITALHAFEFFKDRDDAITIIITAAHEAVERAIFFELTTEDARKQVNTYLVATNQGREIYFEKEEFFEFLETRGTTLQEVINMWTNGNKDNSTDHEYVHLRTDGNIETRFAAHIKSALAENIAEILQTPEIWTEATRKFVEE